MQFRSILLVFVMMIASVGVAQTGTTVSMKTATVYSTTLRFLDKVAGTARDITLKDGETLKLGKLLIIMGECRYPVANPAGDAFAFITVMGDAGEEEIFRGWMIASSPGLNALDHVRYDVWPLRCVSLDAVTE